MPDPADLLAIGVTDAGGAELFRGEGCDACRKTGYKGRVGIYELFLISEEVRSLILRKAPPARSGATRWSAAWSRSARTAGPRRSRVRPRSRRSCASLRKTDTGMPTFAYRAADRQGQTIEGVMEAADARGVVERLQRDAYFPIKVKPQDERRSAFGLTLPSLGAAPHHPRRGPHAVPAARDPDRGRTPRSTARSSSSRISRRTRACARSSSDLLKSIRGGNSLAEAMAKHQPRPFSRLAVNMVRAGEKGGVLEATLKRLAELLEETQAVQGDARLRADLSRSCSRSPAPGRSCSC